MHIQKQEEKSSIFSVNKRNLHYKSLVILLGVFSSLITILGVQTTTHNKYQFILPISFTFAYTTLAPSINRLSWGYTTLNIVWIIRYILLPIMFTMTDYHMPQVNNNHLIIAIFMMLIEMWVSIISIRLYYLKYKQSYKSYENFHTNSPDIIKNISTKLVVALLLLSTVIIIIEPSTLSGFNFIFQQEFSHRSQTQIGIFTIILNTAKHVCTVYLIGFFGIKYKKYNRRYYLLFAVITMFISLSIFQGTSRGGILFAAIAYLAVLSTLFPKQRKHIIIITLIVILTLMLSITLYRFYNTRELGDITKIIDLENLTRQFNAYFAGQYNVAIGVRGIELFGNEYSLQTIIRDIFNNVIVLNKFVPNVNTTTDYFNNVYYGHTLWADQISPLITQAISLFSIVGYFIPVILMKIIVKLDMKALNSYYLFEVFVTALFSITLAFYTPGNLTIIASAIVNNLLPLYIISKISNYKVKN